MKSVKKAGNLEGKRVLVRVDWNVPIQEGVILDDFRIRVTLPTIEYLKEAGAKVILATHLEQASVEPLRKYLPEDVRGNLMRLVQNLKLRLCCPEFILDREGHHVFIDLNPCGDWFGFLDDKENRIIAQEIVQTL